MSFYILMFCFYQQLFASLFILVNSQTRMNKARDESRLHRLFYYGARYLLNQQFLDLNSQQVRNLFRFSLYESILCIEVRLKEEKKQLLQKISLLEEEKKSENYSTALYALKSVLMPALDYEAITKEIMKRLNANTDVSIEKPTITVKAERPEFKADESGPRGAIALLICGGYFDSRKCILKHLVILFRCCLIVRQKYETCRENNRPCKRT
jgi:hypothetical protein